MKWIIVPILVALLLILVVSNIVIVQQSRAYVVERLGAFRTVWNVGLHLKVPFIERVAKKVSLKEQVADFAPQPVITKDNVTMQIDTVIYFQITDPKLYTYGVEYPMNAIENLTATTLRNIIGELELDRDLGGQGQVVVHLLVVHHLEHDDIFFGHSAVIDQVVFPAQGMALIGKRDLFRRAMVCLLKEILML